MPRSQSSPPGRGRIRLARKRFFFFSQCGWTSSSFLGSLRAFSFGLWALFACSDEECNAKLREVELARELAEEEALAATAALIRTEQTLDTIRSRLATAQAELTELRDQLDVIRVQMASLLVNEEVVSEAQALVRFVKEADQAKAAFHQAYEDLLACRRHWEALLDSLAGPDRKIYQEQLDAKLDLVFVSLQRAEQYFNSKESGRHGAATDDGLRVLNVNDDLEVVAVNAGHKQGLRIGQVLSVAEGRAKGAVLRVIEIRPSVSAAIIQSGRLRHLAPGTPLIRVVVPD